MPAQPRPILPPGQRLAARPEDSAFQRLWRGFGTARVAIAAVLLALLAALFALAPPAANQPWLLGLCGAYLAATLVVRLVAPEPRHDLDPQWVSTIGVDLLAISTLQYLQAGGMNYSPLFAVPVLMASVLGSGLLAVGTAAAVALLLLADAWLATLQGDPAQRFVQAGLTGSGYFALAFLANQLAARLAREEEAARRSAQAARIQQQVNGLVIESLTDGVLVVDGDGVVHAANPAARTLLSLDTATGRPLFPLHQPGWERLEDLARRTFAEQDDQADEVALGAAPGRRLFVRTRLASTGQAALDSLCVMFLEDLREMEARLRTEKLAAMGRMSTAVAHEIRNPLAAIAQANALLDEELTDAGQRQLSALVMQNAQRLAQIVDDILDVARAQPSDRVDTLQLDDCVAQACREWANQAGAAQRLQAALRAGDVRVPFADDHLRRVLVNLLDNALRYAGTLPDSIQVATFSAGAQAGLVVWSDGAPLEPAVQQHLFEPFFSSESRSSGLGLFICRELCERHGAQIGYRRGTGPVGAAREGNEFYLSFHPLSQPVPRTEPPATIAA